jgi:RNA polymerase sigma-70 factor (ECF subfamily)
MVDQNRLTDFPARRVLVGDIALLGASGRRDKPDEPGNLEREYNKDAGCSKLRFHPRTHRGWGKLPFLRLSNLADFALRSMDDEVGNEAGRVVPSDEELIGQMAAGRADALRILSHRYGRVIATVAWRILGDNSDAEEVAADVIWQAWRQASGFDRRRGSAAAWLVSIARSRAIERLRARNSRRLPLDQVIEPAEQAFEPTAQFGSARRLDAVKAAMAALDERERQLLDLAYHSDLSQSKIAERIGIPLGTVKTRMRNAMMKLRSALEATRG